MTGTESEREDSNPVAFPSLSEAQLARLKRVAAAVGEGASAVRSVHTAIGVRA